MTTNRLNILFIPGEMRNLAAEPYVRREFDRHRALLRQWLAFSGDSFELAGQL